MATDREDQPMIRQSVQASTWGAIRVANECLSEYRTKARTPESDQEKRRLELRLDLLRRL